MTDLIACYSENKPAQLHVQKVIEGMDWNKIYLIMPNPVNFNLKTNKNIEMIKIDMTKTITELSDNIKHNLNCKINDLEVALNIVSGQGKEHMAVVSALLQLGLGFRLVALTKEGVKAI